MSRLARQAQSSTGSATLTLTMTVTTTSHNGITTHSLNRDGVATGALTFGVGTGDEPPTMAGVTHLVEHVVLRLAQPLPDNHGGFVNEDSITFFASGTGEAVAHFLNKVGLTISAVRAVTDDQIRLEKQVIKAEDVRAFQYASSGLLSYRFGFRGIGVAAFGAPTMHSLSKAEVIEWAQRWLTTQNAALSFTGGVPSDLDVALPSGPPISRAPLPSTETTPRLVESSKAGVALSIVVPVELVHFLGAGLSYEIFARLRHSRGLIYSVNILTTPIDNDSSQLDLVLDPIERNVEAALQASVDAIRDVAEKGFSAEAVDSARSTVTTDVGFDRAGGSVYLDSFTIDGLRGRVTPTHSELLNIAASFTPAQLTDVLVASLPSLIVAVQDDAEVSKKVTRALSLPVDRHSIWRRHKGERAKSEHKRMRNNQRSWRGKSSKNRIWLTGSHLLDRRDGKVSSISLADIVVVGDRTCGCVCLVDRLGRSTELDMRDWAKGNKFRRRLLEAFPPEIVRAFPPDE